MVPSTTQIYTLSLHDALPIFRGGGEGTAALALGDDLLGGLPADRAHLVQAQPDRRPPGGPLALHLPARGIHPVPVMLGVDIQICAGPASQPYGAAGEHSW